MNQEIDGEVGDHYNEWLQRTVSMNEEWLTSESGIRGRGVSKETQLNVNFQLKNYQLNMATITLYK